MSVAPCSLVLVAARWHTFSIAAEWMRDFGSAPSSAAPRAAAADLPACIVAFPFARSVAFLGAIVAAEKRILEAECSGKKNMFWGKCAEELWEK